MKKIIAFITVLCIMITSISGTVVAQTKNSMPPLSLQILGEVISPESPIVENDIIYLPFRAVAEHLGFKVSWYSRLQKMTISKENTTISVTAGSKYGYINNKGMAINYAPIMKDGKLYVPLSFVEANFDYNVVFDKVSNVIIISEKGSSFEADLSSDGNIIYVNNKKLSDDSIPIVRDKKTFLPIRAVAEELGYTVGWFPTINRIKLTKGSDIIYVIINSQTVYLNDKRLSLDGKSFLEDGRAFASTDLFKSILNCNVSIEEAKLIVHIEGNKASEDDEAKEEPKDNPKENPKDNPKEDNQAVISSITDIAYDDSYGFSKIKIIADNKIEYTTFTLNNPERFVIDVQNAVVKTNFSSKNINKGGISKVRIAQNSIVPNKVVRIVIDLEASKECKLVQSLDKTTLSVIYANLIKPITVAKEGNKDVVIISGSSESGISDMKLTNPDRIVIDIKGAIHETAEQIIEVNSPLLKSVRTGQFEEGTARVVLDLNTSAFYNIKREGKTIKIYVSDISFDFMQYKKLYNTAYVDFSLGTGVEYQANLDDKNKLLKLIIPKDLEVEPNKYQFNDNLIEYVEVSKQKVNNKVQTVVTCKMKNLVSYELISPALTSQIRVKFKYNAEKFDDLTIVIDAGHGGKDPGAIGGDGTTEKELNIDVARRLNEKLKAIGFKTIMTRVDDTFIDLATRVDIANSSYADFFMSIHFNSFSSTTKGIETLYFPNTVTEENGILNKQIADIFHKEVVTALNMPSRGITPRPNLFVLNKTKMPAILSELGFISNPDELAKMKTEQYRDMAANALAVSIVKYFRDIQGLDFGFDVQSIYNNTIPQLVSN